MITTDILIIGAGPTGLFTVFEAGLLKLKCHLIDALPQPGGQLTELYPKKPIFDIPGFPSINAGDLVDNLMEQTKQFQPGFTLGETAQTLTKLEDGTFEVITNKGTVHRAKAVAIAGGLGTFDKVTGNRIGSDKNKYLIAMWCGLQENRDKPMEISKELYSKARTEYNNGTNIEFDDFMIGWIGWMASFNGRFFDGGYSGKTATRD